MRSSTVLSTALTWLLVTSILWQSNVAIWLNLPNSGPKCVSEEIQNNVVVLADYHVISSNASSTPEVQGVSVKVTSPYGNDLYHRENVTRGQFAFTTHETGNYLACFWVDEGSHHLKKKKKEEAAAAVDLSISLDWKTGIAAKDWESVAKKEKIEGVELELKKLEGAVEAIHENLIYLKAKEAQMREVNETTNARVAWFSILSLAVCITVAICQLLYLKRYFQKKKLI